MKNNCLTIVLIFSIIITNNIGALTFRLPTDGSNVIGELNNTTVLSGDTFSSIGKRYDIGLYEMIEANPDLNPWMPSARNKVIIPAKFVLPPGPQNGMVINLAELRIYFYHPDGKWVTTHPIGVGKKGWETPLGNARIIEKTKDPTWRPPKSIREANAKKGKILPTVVLPGPDNPLGRYAMRLSMPGYLIHGTNQKGGIGVRSSSGCIRMSPEDIESLFPKVPIGTKVRIIHEQFKFGKLDNKIYVEAHEPLTGGYYNIGNPQAAFFRSLNKANLGSFIIRGIDAQRIINEANGYPILIN